MPVIPHHDVTGEYPWGPMREAFDLGLMNTTVPEEYGGIGEKLLAKYLEA